MGKTGEMVKGYTKKNSVCIVGENVRGSDKLVEWGMVGKDW